MTDARKALADAIRTGELELVFCHPEGKFPALPASQEQRDIVEAALRSLPGTREEVARAAGTQDREAGAIHAIMLSLEVILGGYPLTKRNDRAREAVAAILALPPAPMPEREGITVPLCESFAAIGIDISESDLRKFEQNLFHRGLNVAPCAALKTEENLSRNKLLDDIKQAIWIALDPSQSGTIRDCYVDTMKVLEKFREG